MRACPACGGSGFGPCGNCGEAWEVCRCDNPIELECVGCEGVGDVMEVVADTVEEDDEDD